MGHRSDGDGIRETKDCDGCSLLGDVERVCARFDIPRPRGGAVGFCLWGVAIKLVRPRVSTWRRCSKLNHTSPGDHLERYDPAAVDGAPRPGLVGFGRAVLPRVVHFGAALVDP